MIIGAVDPGVSGAVAVVSLCGDCETVHTPLVDGIIDSSAVMTFFKDRDVSFIVIEKAQAMPRQGVVSMFNYGYSAGQVRAVAQLLCEHHHRLVTPQAWKKYFGLIKSDKNASREKAAQIFPRAASQFQRVRDHGRAEAALLGAFHLGVRNDATTITNSQNRN